MVRVSTHWRHLVDSLWKDYLRQRNLIAYEICTIESKGFKEAYRELHTNTLTCEDYCKIIKNMSKPYLDSHSCPPKNELKELLVYEKMTSILGAPGHIGSLAHIHELLFDMGESESQSTCAAYLTLCAKYVEYTAPTDCSILADMYVRLNHPATFTILRHGVANGYHSCFLHAEKWPHKTNEEMLELCRVAEVKCPKHHIISIRIRMAKIMESMGDFTKFVDILMQTLSETTEEDPHYVAIYYFLGNGYEAREAYREAAYWYNVGFDILIHRENRTLSEREFNLCEDVVGIQGWLQKPEESLRLLRHIQSHFQLSKVQQDALHVTETEIYFHTRNWVKVLAMDVKDKLEIREYHLVAHYERREYKEATAIAPTECQWPRSLRILARCHLSLGETDKARDYLHQYDAKVSDEEMRAMMALEWANFYKSQDRDKSREYFNEAQRGAKRVKVGYGYGFHELMSAMNSKN